MNYRHAFHAGNHTEVFKHSILVMLLEHLLKKDSPFMVLDTHAGLGMYDLFSDQSLRTGEKEDGVERIYTKDIPSSETYLRLLKEVNEGQEELRFYPGSPEITRRMMRDTDRLVACELHPADAEVLEDRYWRYDNVQVQHRNGYEAVKALLPPAERRGLVFIDPPFEERDEAQTMVAALNAGMKRWATGIYCLWYPVKDNMIGNTLAKCAIENNYPKALRIEFLPKTMDGIQLAGSGMLLINTPWQIDEKAEALCKDLAQMLDLGNTKYRIDWLTKP